MTKKDIIKYLNEDYKGSEIIIKEVFLFRNGNVAVFDSNKKQVAFLQGLLSGAKFTMQ